MADEQLKAEWEKVINSTITGEPEEGKEAFHKIFVNKTSAILSNISSTLRGTAGSASTDSGGEGVATP